MLVLFLPDWCCCLYRQAEEPLSPLFLGEAGMLRNVLILMTALSTRIGNSWQYKHQRLRSRLNILYETSERKMEAPLHKNTTIVLIVIMALGCALRKVSRLSTLLMPRIWVWSRLQHSGRDWYIRFIISGSNRTWWQWLPPQPQSFWLFMLIKMLPDRILCQSTKSIIS